MPVDFRKQNYARIKKECLSKGVLFEDPEFPATSKSLYFSKVCNDIEWMRPGELCKVPRLTVDGVTCDDLCTGEINNCWFVIACTALANNKAMWKLVVPDHKAQEFDVKNPYAGIFKFNFWRFGELVEVVVDDRLPTRDGKLVFMHSSQKNEFWSALLEKAYAKLFGDYETLGSGHPADALVDFTGGVSERLEIGMLNLGDSVQRKAFFNKMEAASENKALINCVIRVDHEQSQASQSSGPAAHVGPVQITDLTQPETSNALNEAARKSVPAEPPKPEPVSAYTVHHIGETGPNGLMIGQGYNVTLVKSIEVKKSLQPALGGPTLDLVRLYNPWQGKEYTGPWSDSSKEWKALPANEWSKMGITFDKEGEFWMSFDDWCKYFTETDICHFVNKSYFTLKKTWMESLVFSEWSIVGRNGGNKWDSISFLSNPQYLFDITTDTPDTIMVSVEQRDVSEGRVPIGDKKNTIGFYIMQVERNRRFRIHVHGEQMFQSYFMKSRNVFGTCTLSKGRYVIIPCCANLNGVGQFMLRLYTSAKTGGRMLEEECPKTGCCSGKYQLMTTITVEGIDGLALPEGTKGTIDPYIIIKCEGEKVQSDAQTDTRSPKFNLKATFYRKKPSEPIIIEVYNKKMVFDDFLSEARVDWPGERRADAVFDAKPSTSKEQASEEPPAEAPPEADEVKKERKKSKKKDQNNSSDMKSASKTITSSTRVAPDGNEQGERRTYNLYGRAKEKDVMKPGTLSVFIRSSDDMQML